MYDLLSLTCADNWVEEDGDYLLCGNATGAG